MGAQRKVPERPLSPSAQTQETQQLGAVGSAGQGEGVRVVRAGGSKEVAPWCEGRGGALAEETCSESVGQREGGPEQPPPPSPPAALSASLLRSRKAQVRVPGTTPSGRCWVSLWRERYLPITAEISRVFHPPSLANINSIRVGSHSLFHKRSWHEWGRIPRVCPISWGTGQRSRLPASPPLLCLPLDSPPPSRIVQAHQQSCVRPTCLGAPHSRYRGPGPHWSS